MKGGPLSSIFTGYLDESLFTTVRIRKSWFGQLAGLFYRPARVFMEVSHRGGRAERYRIVPAIAEAGFLVSPTVTTAHDFFAGGDRQQRGADAAGHRDQVHGGAPASVVLPAGNRAYRAAGSGRAPIEPSLPSDLQRELGARSTLYRLWQSVPLTASVSFVPEGLQIHPPIEVALVLDRGASSLELRYGIRDPAWKEKLGGDGACFTLAVERGGEANTLFERCLHPQQKPADQGEQTARLAAQLQAGDKVMLKTGCRAQCKYDWAYVSALQFDAE